MDSCHSKSGVEDGKNISIDDIVEKYPKIKNELKELRRDFCKLITDYSKLNEEYAEIVQKYSEIVKERANLRSEIIQLQMILRYNTQTIDK